MISISSVRFWYCAYFSKISELIDKLNVRSRVKISKPVYELKKKIEKIDSCKVFVLPSRVEGMPQALIEAMARGKIVVGSDSIAIRDLIKDGDNGYLFEFDNPRKLSNKINYILSSDNKKVSTNAKKFVKKFSWNKLVTEIENVFRVL